MMLPGEIHLDASAKHAGMSGQVVAITGAASGIGRALARGLAAAGAIVLALDSETGVQGTASPGREAGPGLVSLMQEVRAVGGRIEAHHLDVTDLRSVERAFEVSLAEYGKVDSVLCCAGIMDSGTAWDMDERRWARVIGTHINGHYACVRAAIPAMLERNEGSIVFFASHGGAMRGRSGFAAYCTAKAGVQGLMRSVADGLRRTNVRAICVLPGAATRMTAFLGDSIGSDDTTLRPELAAGTWRDPANLVPALQYLITEKSPRLNGQTFAVVGNQLTHIPLPRYGATISSGGEPWTQADIADQFARHIMPELTAPEARWPPPGGRVR